MSLPSTPKQGATRLPLYLTKRSSAVNSTNIQGTVTPPPPIPQLPSANNSTQSTHGLLRYSVSFPASRNDIPSPPSSPPPQSEPGLPDEFSETASVVSFATSAAHDSRKSRQVTPTENVQVAVRVRPLTSPEEESMQPHVWQVDLEDGQTIRLKEEYAIKLRRASVAHAYDHAYGGSDNFEIYQETVAPLVHSTMEGYNGTVFAYGQTSSGKTFTMTGTETQPGVIAQAVADVFSYISRTSEQREFLLRVSYLEIYNEQLKDLLSPENTDPRIHEDKRRGVYVSPLKEEIVTSTEQVMRILKRGEMNRHVSETDYNTHSSRSHTVFQMVIESRERSSGSVTNSPRTSRALANGQRMSLNLNTSGLVRVSTLNLIDLAGSEKASTQMDRRKEGSYINRSLLTLGTVIAKLTEDKASHIPYRDSKLTRLLQPSLGGNARVAVICTISPAGNNVEESINTLKFASRVKKVVTKAEANQLNDDKALLQKYKAEIDALKSQLEAMNERVQLEREIEIAQLQQEKQKYEEELHEQQLARTALKERLDHLTKLILTSSSISSKAILNWSGNGPMPQPNTAPEVITKVDTDLLKIEREKEELTKQNAELSLRNQAYEQQIEATKSILESVAAKDAYIAELEALLARIQMQQSDQTEATITSTRQEMSKLQQEHAAENASNQATIQTLRHRIEQLEKQQSQAVRLSTVSTISNSPSMTQSPRLNGGADAERLRELEWHLEKERKLRQEMESSHRERIHHLEAELTICKAELSVAQLMQNFAGGSTSPEQNLASPFQEESWPLTKTTAGNNNSSLSKEQQ